MRLCAFLLSASASFAGDGLSAFGHNWTVPAKADWTVEGSGPAQVLKMLVPHPDTRELPRRPVHFALAGDGPFEDVTIEAEVLRESPRGAVILVYAWQDANHFNYAHLHP